MPPARATVGLSKVKVNPSYNNDLEDVMRNLLDNQRMAINSSESHVDVVLILQDGVIPVHGVLLKVVSPFFRTCFESQGPYYFGTREVIMPDYKMQTMQKVIQLIYSQSVYCQHESETKEVQAAIKDLGIKLSTTLELVQASSTKVDQKEVEAIPPSVYQSTKGTKTVFKPMIARTTIRPTSFVCAQVMPQESSSSEDSGTDLEINEKTISTAAWFIQQAKQCQKCKKNYPDAGKATRCMVSHNRYRCYICFRVCKDTEMLFQHYARVHRKDAAEGFVVCHWCKKSIAFKGLSNHIITTHLSNVGDGGNQPARRCKSRKRPVSKAPRLKGPHVVAAKKAKRDVLKVGDLDSTLTLERDNGKHYLFIVKKKRLNKLS